MLDRERLLAHIKEPALRMVMVRILDKVQAVIKKHDAFMTDFLTPAERVEAETVLNAIPDVGFFTTGGYPDAERQVLVIYPPYWQPEEVFPPIQALEVNGNTQFHTLTHRDYLGAVLGLGMKREKIGDILIHQEEDRHRCQLLVHEEMIDFIYFNLKQVGSVTVSVKNIPLEAVKAPEGQYRTGTGTVSSLRLDAVIAMGMRISRGDAQQLIGRELVTVNWKKAEKGANEIRPGDIITVRGKGRMEITSVEGTTRSGRIRINYRKPV